MYNKQRGILFSVLASLMSGIFPISIKLILDYANIETANVLISVFASIMFMFLFGFSGGLSYFKALLTNLRKVALVGFVYSAGALLNTYGILVLGPMTAVFLLQFSTAFTILFGVVVLKEKLTGREVTGILIAVVGLFILSYGDLTVELLGTLALLGSTLLVALTSLLSKVYVSKINPTALAGGNSFSLLLFIVLYALLFGKLNTPVPSIVLVYAIIGAVLGPVIGFLLFYKALSVYDVSKVATVMTMQPFFTAVCSFAILSLVPTANQLVGGGLVVTGVIFLGIVKEK
jgi:drug/metabolite transporter (DMT)-like permease